MNVTQILAILHAEERRIQAAIRAMEQLQGEVESPKKRGRPPGSGKKTVSVLSLTPDQKSKVFAFFSDGDVDDDHIAKQVGVDYDAVAWLRENTSGWKKD